MCPHLIGSNAYMYIDKTADSCEQISRCQYPVLSFSLYISITYFYLDPNIKKENILGLTFDNTC